MSDFVELKPLETEPLRKSEVKNDIKLWKIIYQGKDLTFNDLKFEGDECELSELIVDDFEYEYILWNYHTKCTFRLDSEMRIYDDRILGKPMVEGGAYLFLSVRKLNLT